MTTSLLLVSLLLVSPLVLADISQNYHNFNQTTTTCGLSPLNKRVNKSVQPIGRSAPYIVDAIEAEYGEWPFLAWVNIEARKCTGVIVDSKLVVTSGVCTVHMESIKLGIMLRLDADDPAFVAVGKVRTFKTDKFEVKHDIKAVQQGAYYKKRGFTERNPLFLRVWLRDPIEFNDYVQPICISSRPEVIYTLMRGPLFFIGNGDIWGDPKPVKNDSRPVLRDWRPRPPTRPPTRFVRPYATQWVQVKPSDPTFSTLPINDKENRSKFFFVPQDDSKWSRGHGDYGGPLVALDENKRWSLVGIFAWTSYPRQKTSGFLLMPKIVEIFDKNFKFGPDDDAYEDDGRSHDDPDL